MFGASSEKCINKRSFAGVFLVGAADAQDSSKMLNLHEIAIGNGHFLWQGLNH